MNYEHLCLRCGNSLFSTSNADPAALRGLIGAHIYHCGCGSSMGLESDGADGVQAVDQSRPGITSITPTSGPIGTRVRVNGVAFNVAPPTVRFGSAVGTNVNVISDTALDVDAPDGDLPVILAEQYKQLDYTNVNGSGFLNGEVITGSTSSAQGTVRGGGHGYLLVATISGTFVSGEHITGAASSTTAVLTSVAPRPFSIGETLQGQDSGCTAVVTSLNPLRAGNISPGGFTHGEEVFGTTSNARAKLGSPWYDGNVDITLDNEYGARDSGGHLSLAFEIIP